MSHICMMCSMILNSISVVVIIIIVIVIFKNIMIAL